MLVVLNTDKICTVADRCWHIMAECLNVCGLSYSLEGSLPPLEPFIGPGSGEDGNIVIFEGKYTGEIDSTAVYSLSDIDVHKLSDGSWLYCPIRRKKRIWLSASADYREIKLYCPKSRGKKANRSQEAFYLRVALVCRLIEKNIFCLHGAAVSVSGSAVIFTGKSGMGKSTRAKDWVDYLGAELISGDRPALGVGGKSAVVYGIPWDGKEQIFNNVSAPLKAVLDVRRMKSTHIRKLTPAQTQAMLIKQLTVPMWDADVAANIMALLRIVSGRLPVYRVFCDRGEKAAREVYDILYNHPELIKEAEEEMKIKEGFLLREVLGEYIVMPVGENVAHYGGAVALNEVSAFVFKALRNPMGYNDVLQMILDKYDVDEATARADLDELLEKFDSLELLDKN